MDEYRGKLRRASGIFMAIAFYAALPTPVRAQTFAPVTGVAFTKVFAGTDPLPQTLTINSAGASFNFTTASSTVTGGAWLSVSVGFGCGSGSVCSTPHSLTITANPSVSLPAGTYTGQVVVTSYPSSAVSMTVPVTLTIAPPNTAFFDNLPGQLSFSLKTGGLTPPAQTIQIRNGGSGNLNWTVTATTADGGNWLNASAPSGAAPFLLSIALVKANLPGAGIVAGTFTGRLLLQAPGGGSVTVPVSVVVGDDVFRQVNGISFTKLFAGANPLPQTLTIAGTGDSFNFTTAVSTATGGDWLSVSVGFGCGSGSVCATPHTLTVKRIPA